MAASRRAGTKVQKPDLIGTVWAEILRLAPAAAGLAPPVERTLEAWLPEPVRRRAGFFASAAASSAQVLIQSSRSNAADVLLDRLEAAVVEATLFGLGLKPKVEVHCLCLTPKPLQH